MYRRVLSHDSLARLHSKLLAHGCTHRSFWLYHLTTSKWCKTTLNVSFLCMVQDLMAIILSQFLGSLGQGITVLARPTTPCWHSRLGHVLCAASTHPIRSIPRWNHPPLLLTCVHSSEFFVLQHKLRENPNYIHLRLKIDDDEFDELTRWASDMVADSEDDFPTSDKK